MEQRKLDYQLLISMTPLARTAFDEKGGRAQADLQKKLFRLLDGFTPWQVGNQRQSLQGKVKPGTVAVVIDGSDNSSNPLFKDAQIVKR